VKAIGVVEKGEIWVSRSVASRLISKLSEIPVSPNSNGLTPREWKVLGLLASGTRNKEIANRLSVSENTVKTHLYTIYRKLNVDCRLAATLYYFQHVKSDGKYPHKSSVLTGKAKKKDSVHLAQQKNPPSE
jgi:LuxR family transcriptional regulator of csgAB operon